MVDQEPHRSVQLIRRIDTRIPSPLLSSAATTSTSIVPAVSLGKLTPLRAPIAQRATMLFLQHSPDLFQVLQVPVFLQGLRPNLKPEEDGPP